MNRKTKFVTNLYAPSKIEVGGACEIIIQKINSNGQVVILVITDRTNSIETYKIKRTEVEDEQRK